MSTPQVQRPVKVANNGENKPANQGKQRSKDPGDLPHRKPGVNCPKKFERRQNDDIRGYKFNRKRSQIYSTGNGKFFPPYKRRKHDIIGPTKFLLGGNIYDPLNLNSLQDEEINRAMNAVTPKSSPLPTPAHRRGQIEILIPPNIGDPLNLTSCEDDVEYAQQLVLPFKRSRKQRKKKKRNSSSGGSSKEDGGIEATVPGMVESVTTDVVEPMNEVVFETSGAALPNPVAVENVQKKDLELPLNNKKDCKRPRKMDLKDKIVSPVIPQPGARKRSVEGRFNRFRSGGNKQRKGQPQQMPKFNPKNATFQYGNYNRYYGYRNLNGEPDLRLKCFEMRKDLFKDKDVLDIGCNIGHVTLSLARDYGARSVVGLDIDAKLIGVARCNVRNYVNCRNVGSPSCGGRDRFFPISMPILYGPIDIPGQSPSPGRGFPHNITFIQGNYVLEDDVLLSAEQPQFDVIVCLSITKWLHLNWGDAGLKRAFKRMFLQLRPGGRLVLEPQAWESYKHKHKLTETTFKNYHSIEFLPHKFTEYLLSTEVGFSKCEVIGTPFHQSKGFRRPIQLFTKAGATPEAPSTWSPEPGRVPIYTSLATPVDEEVAQEEGVIIETYVADEVRGDSEMSVCEVASEAGLMSAEASEIGHPSSEASEIGLPSSEASEIGHPSSEASEIGHPSSEASEIGCPSSETSEVGHQSSEAGHQSSEASEVGCLSSAATPEVEVIDVDSSASSVAVVGGDLDTNHALPDSTTLSPTDCVSLSPTEPSENDSSSPLVTDVVINVDDSSSSSSSTSSSTSSDSSSGSESSRDIIPLVNGHCGSDSDM